MISRSQEETENIGKKLSKVLTLGSVVALYGDLGAGKTAFARGIARGLGVQGVVASPTFTIMHSYEEGRLPLYHYDVYRLSSPDEVLETGWEEVAYGDGVTVVEWAKKIAPFLPVNRLDVVLSYDGEGRQIEFIPKGNFTLKGDFA